MAPCRYCVNRRFGGRYRLHLQGRKIRERGTSVRIFLSWRCRRYVPPKRRFTQDLHGATSQKAAFFIVTAMKSSNLAKNFVVLLSTFCFAEVPFISRSKLSLIHYKERHWEFYALQYGIPILQSCYQPLLLTGPTLESKTFELYNCMRNYLLRGHWFPYCLLLSSKK
jgi:hypothetical protein